MLKLFYIGLGGFFGAISRYTISKWMAQWNSTFPYGTFTVNILGSFLLGFLMTIFFEKTTISPYLRVAITTGFLGALTTFSTFAYETMSLFEDKEILLANINIFSNLIIGLIFVLAGIFLGRTV
ncbi:MULTISPECIES: fluoride efflux transporter CrcB [unclassified Candidatus Frackibacter]|uniref:fluoride efflux transporter CrcB n=1 Tax=unclassified Candidatus Frackibacter TaxID=2648818 RepID=UPI00088525A1|nr:MULTISPECIES: fluoride efflux transporter CrcB [unclassified Candidatus Frackibacter]SDC50729.1 camphor resistance protein CrcB [Candidatus Frackibacter sp. WG11]SEM40482.1 camphor resistance protein CrcB [Candidatus Frackibacter sp. WG12]SFL74888.1 camphor resistance protein CrcB [Candidatus Frackibacter sp. WG13]